jgi:hypothetical protein
VREVSADVAGLIKTYIGQGRPFNGKIVLEQLWDGWVRVECELITDMAIVIILAGPGYVRGTKGG